MLKKGIMLFIVVSRLIDDFIGCYLMDLKRRLEFQLCDLDPCCRSMITSLFKVLILFWFYD